MQSVVDFTVALTQQLPEQAHESVISRGCRLKGAYLHDEVLHAALVFPGFAQKRPMSPCACLTFTYSAKTCRCVRAWSAGAAG